MKTKLNRNRLRSVFAMCLGLLSLPLLLAFRNWEKPPQPPDFQRLKEIAAHPSNPGNVLVASDYKIFENLLPSGQWNTLQDSRREKINRLVSFKEIPDAVFVLTQDGAFQGDLKKHRWKQIFSGKTAGERSVLAFTILPQDPDHWFLGTESGFWESDDRGQTWFRFERFNRKPISFVRFIQNKLFLATAKELYLSEDLTHFRSVFSLTLIPRRTEPESEDEEEDEDASQETAEQDFYHLLSASPNDASLLWLASRKGVFESLDGISWRPLAASGMRSKDCRHLIYSSKNRRLFAGTPKGVYAYQRGAENWQELFGGLEETDIRGLALVEERDGKEILAAVTGGGFYQFPILPDNIPSPKPAPGLLDARSFQLFQQLIKGEPSALEVHKAVIHYANVKNAKIYRWHKASRLGALLPRFSFGRDLSRTRNIDIDRGGTNTPDEFIFGPDDLRKSWDMDLSWDLTDFLYSTAQTSIDSREKLMVELRNDLLAEATRIFYERRRLQLDIVFNPAPSHQEHMQKLLRMDELAALLDGLTNGFFFKRLKQLYAAQPELNSLWDFTGYSRG